MDKQEFSAEALRALIREEFRRYDQRLQRAWRHFRQQRTDWPDELEDPDEWWADQEEED